MGLLYTSIWKIRKGTALFSSPQFLDQSLRCILPKINKAIPFKDIPQIMGVRTIQHMIAGGIQLRRRAVPIDFHRWKRWLYGHKPQGVEHTVGIAVDMGGHANALHLPNQIIEFLDIHLGTLQQKLFNLPYFLILLIQDPLIAKDLPIVGDIRQPPIHLPVQPMGRLQIWKIADNMDVLRKAADVVKAKLTGGAFILGTVSGDKVNLVGMASPEAVKAGVHMGKVVSKAAKVCGGGGGGKPAVAQAGGRDTSKLEEAVGAGVAAIADMLG